MRAADRKRRAGGLDVRQGFVVRADVYRWAERWVPIARSGPVYLFFSPPFADLDPVKLEAFLGMVKSLMEKAPEETVLTIQADRIDFGT